MLTAAICLVFLAPATFAAGYYFLLTAVGWRRPRPLSGNEPQTRFAVLIPAHDEEVSMSATLASVFATDYPKDQFRVVVIADNCTDRTSEIARRCGADVLERFDAEKRGKGHALAFGLPHVLAGNTDAVVILDADCQVDPAIFRVLDEEFGRGSAVVQAACRSIGRSQGPAGLVTAVGSEIENSVQAGLHMFGRSAWLRGTGMAFCRDVLERYPWNAFGLVEDVEYAGQLKAAGIRIRFAANAVVRAEPPPGVEAMCQQRRRWREALFATGKNRLDRAVASKPLVLGHLMTTTIMAVISGESWAFGWVVGIVAATVAVYIRAIRRVEESKMAHLWCVPGIVARIAWVTAVGFIRRETTWERTARANP